MNPPCENHPSVEALQLCDQCSRFLCRECLGEPLETVARTYYFCFAKACDAAFNKRIKLKLLPPLLLVPSYLFWMFPWSKSSWLFLGLSWLIVTQDLKYFRAYRQRVKLRQNLNRLC